MFWSPLSPSVWCPALPVNVLSTRLLFKAWAPVVPFQYTRKEFWLNCYCLFLAFKTWHSLFKKKTYVAIQSLCHHFSGTAHTESWSPSLLGPLAGKSYRLSPSNNALAVVTNAFIQYLFNLPTFWCEHEVQVLKLACPINSKNPCKCYLDLLRRHLFKKKPNHPNKWWFIWGNKPNHHKHLNHVWVVLKTAALTVPRTHQVLRSSLWTAISFGLNWSASSQIQ